MTRGQQNFAGDEKVPGLHELAERYLTLKESAATIKEELDGVSDRLAMKMHSIQRVIYEVDGIRIELEEVEKLKVKTVKKKK